MRTEGEAQICVCAAQRKCQPDHLASRARPYCGISLVGRMTTVAPSVRAGVIITGTANSHFQSVRHDMMILSPLLGEEGFNRRLQMSRSPVAPAQQAGERLRRAGHGSYQGFEGQKTDVVSHCFHDG